MTRDLYADVNRTELVAIIAELGFQVNPELPKERMVEILRGSDPLANEISPMQELRQTNRDTLNIHWHSLQLQLVTTCKGACRKEGALCPDMMVLLCFRRMEDLRKHKGRSPSTKRYRIVESQEPA